MQVLQVKEYNRLDMQRYSKLYDEWSNEYGYNSTQYPPQQAFFGFYTNQGQFRQTGYVAFDNKRDILRDTKKQAIQEFERNYI